MNKKTKWKKLKKGDYKIERSEQDKKQHVERDSVMVGFLMGLFVVFFWTFFVGVYLKEMWVCWYPFCFIIIYVIIGIFIQERKEEVVYVKG